MNHILKALGVTDEGEGLVVLAKMNAFLTSIVALFGTREFSESLAVISANHNTAKAIEKLTGKTGDEAIGTLTAWKSAEERATKAEVKNAEIEKGIEATKAKALIDGVISDKRLEPAKRELAQSLYDDSGMKALEGFVAALPAKGTALPGDPNVRPPSDPKAKGGDLSAAEKRVMKVLGKSKAQMIEARRILPVAENDEGEEIGETRFIVEETAAA